MSAGYQIRRTIIMPFHPAPSSILDWHWYSIFFAGDSFVKWMRKIVFISAVIKAYCLPSSVDNNSDQNKIRKISLEYTLCPLRYTQPPAQACYMQGTI